MTGWRAVFAALPVFSEYKDRIKKFMSLQYLIEFLGNNFNNMSGILNIKSGLKLLFKFF